MKQRGLPVLTVFTILLTGVLTAYAGWFSPGRPGSHHPDPHSHAKAREVGLTDAAWRYRRCQPVHWRAMLLQH